MAYKSGESCSTIPYSKGLLTDAFSWVEFMSIKLLSKLKEGLLYGGSVPGSGTETGLAPPKISKGSMTMKHSARLRSVAVLGYVASILIFCATAAIAADYPERPIRLMVPGAAGGGMDVIARLVANTNERKPEAVSRHREQAGRRR